MELLRLRAKKIEEHGLACAGGTDHKGMADIRAMEIKEVRRFRRRLWNERHSGSPVIARGLSQRVVDGVTQNWQDWPC